MVKIILIDGIEQSRNLIENNIEEISNVELLASYKDFSFDCRIIDDANIIIFDVTSANCDEVVEKIYEFKKINENLKFIATSYEINAQLTSKILSYGINDFLIKPIITPILEASIEKLNTIKEKKANVISVFSNKGGVGKTSLAVNLAWELYKKTEKKVCILDLSFNNENAIQFLNIENKFDSDIVLKNLETTDKKLLLSMISKYENSKLHVLELRNEFANNKYTKENISKIIAGLKNIFDYLVIDLSSLINEFNLSVINNSDIILLLGILNKSSIKNLDNCYKLFDKISYNSDKIKLIINRYSENSQVGEEDFKKELNSKVFNTIPNNYLTLIDAINLAKPTSEVHPHSNIAKAYSKIADDILNIDFDKLSKNGYNHGIFNLLQKMGEE